MILVAGECRQRDRIRSPPHGLRLSLSPARPQAPAVRTRHHGALDQRQNQRGRSVGSNWPLISTR